ncbi:hypothetical protein MMC12_008339 [Toensbergia leucococca]|nr:hypothetical protein [Toensbergia leucococca]
MDNKPSQRIKKADIDNLADIYSRFVLSDDDDDDEYDSLKIFKRDGGEKDSFRQPQAKPPLPETNAERRARISQATQAAATETRNRKRDEEQKAAELAAKRRRANRQAEQQAKERERKQEEERLAESARRHAEDEQWATQDAEAREQERLRNIETQRLKAERLRRKKQKSSCKEGPSGGSFVKATAWDTWSTACESLANPSTLIQFPDPPTYGCKLLIARKNACLKGDHLQACHHDLERMLRTSGEYCHDFLRKLTFRFHPDKFSACSEEVRGEMEGKAKDLFQMLRKLMETAGR